MIVGLGIDMVDIDRIERAIARNGDAFIKRIAHPVELKGAPKSGHRQAEYWAARFAAKEAFAKALGTGIGRIVALHSVGVSKNKSGKPGLAFSDSLKKTLLKRAITRSHLAITHTPTIATAVVVLEKT